jgi:hypothetical protein
MRAWEQFIILDNRQYNIRFSVLGGVQPGGQVKVRPPNR